MPVEAVKINLGRVREFSKDMGTKVNLLKLSIAVFHLSDDRFYALHNCCPKGGELVEGAILGEHIFCPQHDCKINVKNGVMQAPDSGQIETFHVEVEDSFIYLTLA
ncbi:Rieske 2Fe-2S domain-containing protein [Pseudalkalibacillus hwajinpoensis]|uniref:Rieske 2Fe-2S domain-containing protein n=1 Tax=Guptibacillus hwajinpoensis TaxID=208199 RepID=UPI00325C1D05